jgi:hypothetical protein
MSNITDGNEIDKARIQTAVQIQQKSQSITDPSAG